MAFLVSLQKLFSFSGKSKSAILDIQVSWRHQIPKLKTRNTFYWTTWEVNTSLLMKFDQFTSYYEKKSKNSTKTVTWKLVTRPFVFAKNKAQPLLENETFEVSYFN